MMLFIVSPIYTKIEVLATVIKGHLEVYCVLIEFEVDSSGSRLDLSDADVRTKDLPCNVEQPPA